MTNFPATPNNLPYALIEIDRSFAVAGQGFTYAVPERLRAELQIGHAVHVPFGSKTVTGYITDFTDRLDFDAKKLKPISSIVSALPVFDEMGLRLARWMSAYYHTPLNECLACLMPHGWQNATVKKYFYQGGDYIPDEIRRSPRQLQIALMLQNQTEPQTIKNIENHLGQKNLSVTLNKLVDANIVGEITEFSAPKLKPKIVKAARLTKAIPADDPRREVLFKKAYKQGELYRRLEAKSTFDAIPLTELGGTLSLWRGLEEKKLIELCSVEVQRRPESAPLAKQNPVTLMPQQQNAVKVISAALEEKKPATILLHGVTASGKTEVYLAAIEKCLQAGKRALVLVPEIALTAQTVDIFQRRFGEKVAILHSALGGGERFDEWRRVRAGEADIVVGARSAVFAPCDNLGLIIIDEEHDHSYKQDNTPRYHARAVATRRAALENAVLVLGSATPSMESFLAARQNKFTLIEMPQRVEGRALPEVEIVDMTSSVKGGEMPILSARLKDEICATLAQNKQVILFLNRRGFATYVQCVGCGHVEQCPNCDIALTYHRGAELLKCHHCGHAQKTPETCPECNGWMLGFTGTGTEKVEGEVQNLLGQKELSHIQISRLDRDTTTTKGSHAKILSAFRKGESQILIGTQMVTKGLDFPNVTLVGAISADTGLNVPDFRASERTFQLLSQVAGRAGRGDTPGKVLIQTLTSDHFAIEAARLHDYHLFANQEIEARKTPPYPPFSYLVNLMVSDEDAVKAKARIEAIALHLESAINKNGGTEMLGPVECPLARVKGKFRFHLLLRDRNRPRLHQVLDALTTLPTAHQEGLLIDVDPMSIM